MSNVQKFNEISRGLKDRSPKQMRTLRNQLNNRIKSFEDEGAGKGLPKLSDSHPLSGLNLDECKKLQNLCKSELKSMKQSAFDEEE
jgi:hypothetical protein